MAVTYKVVSIGTLSRNPFWREQEAVRTAHATTTLIVSGDRRILVDPALPATALEAHLFERSGLKLADINAVFLTTFRAAHRMGLAAITDAQWYIHEQEKGWAKQYIESMLGRLRKEGGTAHQQVCAVEDDLAILDRCQPAPEKLAEGVEIFPSPGTSPGGCGLLLTTATLSVVVAGDAVIGQEYLESGRVWEGSHDVQQAQRSLADILEVADLVIPGHDNILPVPGRFGA